LGGAAGPGLPSFVFFVHDAEGCDGS